MIEELAGCSRDRIVRRAVAALGVLLLVLFAPSPAQAASEFSVQFDYHSPVRPVITGVGRNLGRVHWQFSGFCYFKVAGRRVAKSRLLHGVTSFGGDGGTPFRMKVSGTTRQKIWRASRRTGAKYVTLTLVLTGWTPSTRAGSRGPLARVTNESFLRIGTG